MLRAVSKLLQTALIALFVVALSLPASAQGSSSSTAKKSGASASCDGALDIVPGKAMTFARKRRPAKSEGKPQTTPAESKTEQKQTDKKGR